MQMGKCGDNWAIGAIPPTMIRKNPSAPRTFLSYDLPGRRAVFLFAAVLLGNLIAWAAADGGFDRMRQVAAERYGEQAVSAVTAWQEMVAAAAGLPEQEQLRRINSFFNRRTHFDDDIVIWREADYWATPLETLARAAGDCEDFSIAKYMTLRQLGIPAEKLRLIYVRATIGAPGSGVSQAHMVLGYYDAPDAEPLVLDNLIGDIRPAGRRPDLFPVFSFNDAGLWVGGARNSSADPTSRLSRWRNVLERMRNEGLAVPNPVRTPLGTVNVPD
jgi:predicted transglutaminase-like cysteine proteinase